MRGLGIAPASRSVREEMTKSSFRSTMPDAKLATSVSVSLSSVRLRAQQRRKPRQPATRPHNEGMHRKRDIT